MASYVFTEKAERDLETIVDYTMERWGTKRAIKYIESLGIRTYWVANFHRNL